MEIICLLSRCQQEKANESSRWLGIYSVSAKIARDSIRLKNVGLLICFMICADESSSVIGIEINSEINS